MARTSIRAGDEHGQSMNDQQLVETWPKVESDSMQQAFRRGRNEEGKMNSLNTVNFKYNVDLGKKRGREHLKLTPPFVLDPRVGCP